MEYNGLKINKELGDERQAELTQRLIDYNQELAQYIPELPPELEFSWSSRFHKSYLIFGGTAKYQKWVQHTGDNNELLYATKNERWPLFDGVPTNPEETTSVTDSKLLRRTSDGAIQDTF